MSRNRPRGDRSAPWFKVPADHMLCIEHPARIVNVDKAMETIGGIEGVTKAFNGEEDIKLKWRPEDITAPPIEGKRVLTSNVLLKITVPKSSGSVGAANSCSSLIDKLRGCNGNYKVEAIGNIPKTVRFRDMSDFQWNSSGNSLVTNIRENILPLKLGGLKEFTMSSETISGQDMEFVRPPSFTSTFIPHVYGYNQNINMRTETVDGETHLLNMRHRKFIFAPILAGWGQEMVPDKPSDDLPTVRGSDLKECISELRKLLEDRPIWTRRALRNSLPVKHRSQLKQALPYVAYFWREGPWRDTCTRLGVDPRKSVDYAIYQVVAFKMDFLKTGKAPEHVMSHIFDGENVYPDGKVYQFCDITDPLIQPLVEPDGQQMRDELDIHDGWYLKNRMFKIKLVLREKIKAIHEGRSTNDPHFRDLIGRSENELDAPEMVQERQMQVDENEVDVEEEEEEEEDDEEEDDSTAADKQEGADDDGDTPMRGESRDFTTAEDTVMDDAEDLGSRHSTDAQRNKNNEGSSAKDRDQIRDDEKVKRLMSSFLQANLGLSEEERVAAAAEDFGLLGDN